MLKETKRKKEGRGGLTWVDLSEMHVVLKSKVFAPRPVEALSLTVIRV